MSTSLSESVTISWNELPTTMCVLVLAMSSSVGRSAERMYGARRPAMKSRPKRASVSALMLSPLSRSRRYLLRSAAMATTAARYLEGFFSPKSDSVLAKVSPSAMTKVGRRAFAWPSAAAVTLFAASVTTLCQAWPTLLSTPLFFMRTCPNTATSGSR